MSTESVSRALEFIQRGFRECLGFASSISNVPSFAGSAPSPPEVFTTLLVAQSLLDAEVPARFVGETARLLNSMFSRDGLVHFFRDPELLVADLDCTAVAHSLRLRLGAPHPALARALPLIVSNTNEVGVLEVYFRPAGVHGGRVDACVLVNALYLLHQLGLADRAQASWLSLVDFLVSDAYLEGTRYYPSPDTFLYFLSRLVRDHPQAWRVELGHLRQRLEAREGIEGSCLERALRITAANNVGLRNTRDIDYVVAAQLSDGSWPASAFFRYGRSVKYFGSEALSTAFAIEALVAAGSARDGGLLAAEDSHSRSRFLGVVNSIP